MRSLLSILLFLTIVTASSHASLSIRPLTQHSVSIDDKKVSLYSPVMIVDNTNFIPIRDILFLLKATLKYKRKSDSYVLKTPVSTCILIPNSKEILINGNRHFLTQSIRNIKGRIYIPTEEFLRFLGYSYKHEKTSISIHTSNKKYISDSISTSIGYSEYDLFDNTNIPKLRSSQEIKLSLFNKNFNISSSFFYDNKELYVHMFPILESSGFNIKHTNKKEINISYNTSTYLFNLKEGTVDINTPHSHKKIHLPSPVIYKDGHPFISFKSFVSVLDFGVFFNKSTKTIHLLSRINNVSQYADKKGPSFLIHSSHILSSSKSLPMVWTKGYYIDIPNSYSTLKKSTFNPKGVPFSSIETTQYSPTTTRIRFISKTHSKYPSFSPTPDGLSVYLIRLDVA